MQTAAQRFTQYPSENIPGRPSVVVLGPELQQHQTIYVRIETGARLDSGGNSFVSLADSDSNFAVAEQVIVPKCTVTFQAFAISFTVSVLLAGWNAYLTGPGDPRIGLNLITVVLMNGAWIFVFSVTFQLAFNTDALPLSPTGHVALSRTASLNVVARHLEDPLEDFSTPRVGSLMGDQSDFAFCFTEGVGASPEWGKMIRITARSMGSCLPLGHSGGAHVWSLDQSGPGIRQPV